MQIFNLIMVYSYIKYFLTNNSLVNYYYYNDYFNKLNNVLEFIPTIKTKIKDQSIEHNERLINSVAGFCQRNNIKENGKVIVSLSGGVDSMVLTTILKYLNYDVIGIHINYNNRKETSEEQEFLEEWCNSNNIKLYVNSITKLKRGTIKRSEYEYESKNIRFNFYKEVMQKENLDFILLAHHKDDIVENIFANVCRGRYILDLAVIKEQSLINNIMLMRPLIDHYKTCINDFSNKYQVPYFKDTTPEWSVRGRYRNQIYPLLQQTFSYSIKENLLGLSKQSYDWNELIMDEIINPFLNSISYQDKKCTFRITDYRNKPLCFWNVVFMKIFYKYGKNCPSRRAIQVFINTIQTVNVSYISLSDYCKCRNKNDEITIEFK